MESVSDVLNWAFAWGLMKPAKHVSSKQRNNIDDPIM